MLIDPLELPSVPLSELKKLPACSAIYFAIDAEGRPLYVGQASNLLSRWRNHHRVYQLTEEDKKCPVRIAWKAWNPEGLAEAEKILIQHFQPLFNGTEVKSPAVTPSESVLRDFLKTFSRRLIILGFEPKTSETLPSIYLKYDWTDCSAKGTAAKIKSFIQEIKDKNTSLKIKRKPYGRLIDAEVFRPGSRAQRANARQNRSYNNHWYMGCNGAIVHITPTDEYRDMKDVSVVRELAGIKLKAIPAQVLVQIQSNPYSSDSSGLSCFERDLIPLLWTQS
ncbi:GIY-YIG nuclease family protein [Trichocoleus sp. FACHB-591]|uniref:GIY-YIG nuclease family protein n=1 Tax=Trichocoleus sp. FACHB-591 TaxID=2692872 RepID=UPI001686EBBE|nr:GIY-YIG nuclease family protein [Trichocoleus sp. FACHB-591]MBD2095850.1 GIY-YIG nuclease family protein [Trichocoleus sp. FACHB-591]